MACHDLPRLERDLERYRAAYRKQPFESYARECETLFLLIQQIKAEQENAERDRSL